MSNSVADVIGRLRFVSSPAPAIYLNDALVTETFIAHLGAVESFTRTADHQVTAGVKSVVEVGGAKGTQEQVAYDLTNPLTQALVLHSALGSEGQVQQPSVGTSVGAFVEAVGSVYFPGRPELMQPPPPDLNDAALSIETEGDRQSQVAQAFGMTDTRFLSMLLKGQGIVCGSVVDQKHLRPGVAASYLPNEQICFGIMERVVRELPVFTMLYMRAYV
jgi:hypothetical protein